MYLFRIFALFFFRVEGVLGARIVFAILCAFAVFTWIWRVVSPKFRKFHEDGEARQAMIKVTGKS